MTEYSDLQSAGMTRRHLVRMSAWTAAGVATAIDRTAAATPAMVRFPATTIQTKLPRAPEVTGEGTDENSNRWGHGCDLAAVGLSPESEPA